MKELSYEEWQKNPTPRMMWVWDDNENNKVQRKVIYIIDKQITYRVMALIKSELSTESFMHCAEIEEPKKRRMTKQELTWWLQDGIKEGKHREWKFIDLDASAIHNIMFYIEEESNDLVGTDILIRENGGKWHEPLVEVVE